jgi:hypothetical protein
LATLSYARIGELYLPLEPLTTGAGAPGGVPTIAC